MTILRVEVRDYNLKISIYTTVTLTRQLYVYLMSNERYEGNREVILIGNNGMYEMSRDVLIFIHILIF